jgi:hypothetical protein
MSILKQYPRNKNQYTSNIIYDNNQILNKKAFKTYDESMEQNTNVVTPIRDLSIKKLSKTINIEHMSNMNNYDNDSVFSDDYSLNESNNNINTKFLNTQQKFIDDIASDYDNDSNVQSPIIMTNGCDQESLEGYDGQFQQLKLNHNGLPATMQGNGSDYNITNNRRIDSSILKKGQDGRYDATGEMTHNNMMPFFKSKSYGYNPMDDKIKNGMRNDKLELFTGSEQMTGFAHKTETKRFFDNEQNKVESVTGMPNFSDYMQSRVIPSQTMNGVKPFQPIMQTPGLNLGYNQRGNTGYQDYYRPLPKTIDELRTVDNPQTSYTLPMNEAGLKYNKGAVIGKYHKQKPDRFYENSYDSMLPTDAPMTAPKLEGKIDMPITNRDITSEKKHLNHAKYQTTDKTYQYGEYKAPFKQTLEENGPRNANRDTRNQVINHKSYHASDTNRAQTAETKYLNTINGNKQESVMANYVNMVPDVNNNKEQQQLISNTQGNYKSMPLENFTNIIPDATKRNMSNVTQIGNASNHIQNYLYNYINSIPDETLKSILSEKIVISNTKGNMEQGYMFNNKNATPNTNMRNYTEDSVYVGPLSNKEQSYIYNYANSTPNTTLRELVNTCWNGMLVQGNFQQAAMFNFENNIPNATLREMTENKKHLINTKGNKQKTKMFNFKNGIPSTTLKEMTEQVKHLKSVIGNKQKSTLFNFENSVPDTTLKEQIENTKQMTNVANQYLQKSQMFNYDDKAKTTLRELVEDMNHLTNIGSQILNKGQMFNYENNIAEQTNRSMTENTKNISGMKGNNTQQRSRGDANNMLVNTQKEIISKGRKPTTEKGNRGPTTLFTEYKFNDDNNSQNSLFSGIRTKPIQYF